MVQYFDINKAISAYGSGQKQKKTVDDRRSFRDFAQSLRDGNYDAGAAAIARTGDVNGAMNVRNIPYADQANQLGNEFTRTRIDDVGIDNQRADRTFAANQAQRRYKNAREEAEARLKVAEGPTFGKSPIYGTDENGNTVIVQVADDGSAVRTPLPEGVNITPGIQKFDTGTEIVMVDSRSGNVISRTPKDVAGAAEQGVVGKNRAEQSISAPKEAAQLQQTLDVIGDLKTDPNRQIATGKSSVFNAIPGSGGFDYQQKVAQLSGKTFLQAREFLKGTGALSDAESLKGEQAMARLNTAQSEEAFMAALNDLEEATTSLLGAVSQVQSGRSPQQQQQQQAAPQPLGQTSNGVKWSIE